ncbi:Membrane-anchored ubiquitin-fold protein 5 [Frankliniella fusca]|uniref:Membrane-anchored ubiquitin-fold protein 5 n=1 Tax=Frankliniella fusca TaxID=407009 RepID=A0AAE1HRA7_9NEOP|nr:Membrane-anchored ubiquitin-fold protein 5 [Frankliniella fusca]
MKCAVPFQRNSEYHSVPWKLSPPLSTRALGLRASWPCTAAATRASPPMQRSPALHSLALGETGSKRAWKSLRWTICRRSGPAASARTVCGGAACSGRASSSSASSAVTVTSVPGIVTSVTAPPPVTASSSSSPFLRELPPLSLHIVCCI